MPNVADSNSFSPVPLSTTTCTKGSAASARRFRTCALINSICDVILPESFLVCSHGLLNPVKHCRKDIFLHDQILRAADSAARKCGHTRSLQRVGMQMSKEGITRPWPSFEQNSWLHHHEALNEPAINRHVDLEFWTDIHLGTSKSIQQEEKRGRSTPCIAYAGSFQEDSYGDPTLKM
jgi:hypothetical protein